MHNLLIIGYIWPEPNRTAAGYRMLQLIDLFIDQGYQITFCSAAKIKSTSRIPLESRGVKMIPVQLNSDLFDDLLNQQQPEVVLYDRFLIEEQFGWRVRKVLPNAIQIIDTEDLHFLRTARKNHIENGISLEEGFQSELAVREISSVQRVDMNLIISSFEMELLIDQFQILPKKLFYLPFLIKKEEIESLKSNVVPFEKRSDFCTIGNLKHAPNLDAVRQLHRYVWPEIRSTFPDSQLFIYGSNAPKEILELHSPENGFHIKGHAKRVEEVLSKHRVLLAPLRYGAGLKGKLYDAMKYGIPSVMTSIGAEGMFSSRLVSGVVCDEVQQVASTAYQLYADLDSWNSYQEQGFKILQDEFEESAFAKAFFLQLQITKEEARMNQSFNERMLTYHANAHFKYMSHWINAKK
ncbi:glycosyltransferase [Nonlabens marinus]|uniref:Conserved domain protein n=1 Tax=Nonlabens marinus S1-08 TaxID=1454201 RepID=W8W0J1_9FLAO|nr:glycosyltransferase [Nonlabens marinus]BAO56416.1 conserved domain protein [Nonlabens marinus S1-08]